MHQQGFSLLQLMIATAVAGVLIHLAVPHYQGMTQALRRQVMAQELHDSLRAARSEAVLRGRDVLMHPLEGNWANGWRIVVAPDEAVLRVHQGNPKVRVQGNGPVREQVRFNANGWGRLEGGGFLAGTIHVCDGLGYSDYQVVVAMSGRVHLTNKRAHEALCSVQRSDRLDA